MGEEGDFADLLAFLEQVPAIEGSIGKGKANDGRWWVKFTINTEHRLAWHVVQEFGHVLNYVSTRERLPTRFMPVSPPPYLNGGPREFLSWVIECDDPTFKPSVAAEWLAGQLPRPVDDEMQWANVDQD